MKYFLYALALALIVMQLSSTIYLSWWLILMPIYGLWISEIIIGSIYAIYKKKKQDKIESMFKDPNKSKFQNKLDMYMHIQNKSNRNQL